MYDDMDFAPDEDVEEEDELVQDWTDPDFAPDLSTEDQLFLGQQLHRGWPPEGVTRPYQRGIIDSPEYWMGDVMQGQGHGRPNLQEWDNRVGSQTDTGPSVRPPDRQINYAPKEEPVEEEEPYPGDINQFIESLTSSGQNTPAQPYARGIIDAPDVQGDLLRQRQGLAPTPEMHRFSPDMYLLPDEEGFEPGDNPDVPDPRLERQAGLNMQMAQGDANAPPFRPELTSPDYEQWYNDHIKNYGAPPNLPPPKGGPKGGEDEPKGGMEEIEVAGLTPPYGTRREPSVNSVAQDPRDINQFIRRSLQQEEYRDMPPEARDVHEQIDMIRGAAPRARPQDIQQFLEEQMRRQGLIFPPLPEEAIPPEYEEDVFRGRRFG